MSTHKNQSTQLKRFAFCGKKHQTGVATILVVLLVSVALAATTFGVVSSIKNTQQLQVSSQTINQAQSSAWMLAEATRRYLSTLNVAALQALDGQPLTLAPPTANDPIKTLLNNSSILINSVTPDPTSGQRVDVSIKAIDTNLQASSNLNLVFVVQPGQSSTSICEDGMAKQLRGKVPNSNMQYSDNSKEGGFIVDGSIASNNNQVTLNGVDSLHATGSIALKGTTMETLELIKANDDITLEGAINADVVLSGGDVRISNNSNVRKIVASGSIYWESSGTTSDLQAGESITVLNGTHVNSLSLLDTTLNFTNGNWANILSHANLVFNSNTQATSASAYGNVICSVKPNIKTLRVGGTHSLACGLAAPPPAPADDLPKPETYIPIDLDIKYLADADSYEANYHFFYDGTTKVRVRNVNGIVDGDYVVYDKNGTAGLADFIHPVGGTPAATDPALCNSNNNTIGCINFSSTGRVETTNDTLTPDGYWEITANDPQLAPGVVYFDRDLRLNGGGNSVLFNSFLVAGNIQITGGNPAVVSLNAMKTTELCGNIRSTITEINKSPAAFKVLAPNAYPYPTNFCKSATEQQNPAPKGGNFALLAGQYNGAETKFDTSKATPQYQGGDIYIKSSSTFMGDVLAGNTFKFAGGTNIKFYGVYGSEAQRQGPDEAENEIGDEKGTANKEVFDRRDTGKDEKEDCKPKTGASGDTRLLWSRFQ
jgi:type II secretory pathway pseudopilin PulG